MAILATTATKEDIILNMDASSGKVQQSEIKYMDSFTEKGSIFNVFALDTSLSLLKSEIEIAITKSKNKFQWL